jgi:hypothetical protein
VAGFYRLSHKHRYTPTLTPFTPASTELFTDKKENQIFLIFMEIQNGAVAKSYRTNGLLIYREIFAHFLIYWEALPYI